MGAPYTQEQIDFLLTKGNIKAQTLEEIAAEFTEKFGRPCTAATVAYVLHKHNVFRGSRCYTQEQIDFLLAKGNTPWPVNLNSREFFERIAAEFTEKFGRPSSATCVRGFFYQRNIHKGYRCYTQEQINFVVSEVKGNPPTRVIVEKFTERFGISCTVRQIRDLISHHHPENRQESLPVGTERMWNVGRRQNVLFIKVAGPNVWKPKYRVLWESANGPLPKGCAVIFADGNQENFALDNLMKVSKAEMFWLKRYRLVSDDKELTATAVLLARMSLAAGKREKEMFGEREHRNRRRRRMAGKTACPASDETASNPVESDSTPG